MVYAHIYRFSLTGGALMSLRLFGSFGTFIRRLIQRRKKVIHLRDRMGKKLGVNMEPYDDI